MYKRQALVLSMTVGAAPVLAAGDPLAVINNLSTFIFSLIRAIGLDVYKRQEQEVSGKQRREAERNR